MRKQKRHILLFLDNAPVHPPDVQIENIKLKFFPPNTTAKIQPMDQGVIRAFKVNYRRHLVKHIIISGGVAVMADDININVLDVVDWIQGASEAVSEITIRNTFKSAGIEKLFVIDGIDASIDDNAPSFNDWNDSNDKLLVINGIINDDGDSNEDQLNDDVASEDAPSLSEFLDLVPRLRFFSAMQQPELHSFIIEL
ncbi:unnamed protein product [Rotaria magnacalcarata]|uniref:DDE-1 domain-containing protein n=1 Tax=Rotaria magnacalcarata TaxID=392030 RepID=A0A816XF52_9BILA|nr:unnamed protein product [Rotaria magnacalcarata]CAF4586818.1 unnamed protein product [Rotaria magnacalcarata]